MSVYLFRSSLNDIIAGSSAPVGLCEGEVKWPGDTITARKYCLNIPTERRNYSKNLVG